MKKQKTNYGNWVSVNIMSLLWSISGIFLIVWICNRLYWGNLIIEIIFGILFLIATIICIYMQICQYIFSFNGGRLMEKFYNVLIKTLKWSGSGTLIDIGCGAGALSIKCAKYFSNSSIIGIDYWGKEWNYAKEQCENNARTEGVSKQIVFQNGDAAKLDFPSEYFEAAVSNFVFHEVRTQSDKRAVVKEALRVVKKGGAFAFHDLFEQKHLYGDIGNFLEELKQNGIAEIHYIPHTESLEFIPLFCKAPWMLKNMGLIYGIK
ncbi:methyltransferase domain-containing protein [Clostridium niameyense]|uniref:methyltransferase domain-containing protein n=1 Tax=Clostridium niameyense TaxID=1622073 RepID=UPI00067EABD1